jgi:WD40 repeat protein
MEKEVLPSIEFQAHQDCVNGVSFHPTLPILATTSGQRIYPIIADDEDELFTMSNTPYENSLKLWWTRDDHLSSDREIEMLNHINV